ncbi:MAG TPA: sulfatase-like hydrolase/transferase, partial [Myxococcota bacterium]|nr:sulfatase-like hydrolase/transferase [Myxococcota bacterium]
ELLGRNGYRTGVVSDFAGDVFTRGDWAFHHVDTARFTLASNVALGGLKLHLHLLPWLVEVFDARLFRPELLSLERLADPGIIEDAAIDFIAEDPDRPWFLVAFFSAGHFPFASPAPYWHAFADPDYRGRSRFLKQSFGTPLDDAASAAERAHLFSLYKGAIAASDAAIGRLLARLEAANTLDSTVILVTADHGENLYEHGLGMGHGDHLYGRESLEVPLILDYPGNPDRGRRIDHPITLCDVAPTLAGRLAPALTLPLELPPVPFAGTDLVAALRASHTNPELLAERPIFAEIDLWFFPPETRRLDGRRIVTVEGFAGFTFDAKTWAIYLDAPHQPHSILAKHRMVLQGDKKLLYIPTRDGVRWELYAPLEDPGDLVDLAATEPQTTARLAETLWSWMLRDPLVERRGDFLVPRLARSR